TAVIGDSAAIGLDDAVYAAFDGDPVGLDRALDRIFDEGVAAVSAGRALPRPARAPHRVCGLVASGGRPPGAVLRRGAPAPLTRRQAFTHQARTWPSDRLADLLGRLLDAEIECKSTGMPDEAILRRAALRVVQGARALKRTPVRR